MIIDQKKAEIAEGMLRQVRRGQYRGVIGRMLERESRRGSPMIPQRAQYAGAVHVDIDYPDGRGVRLVVSHDVGHHKSGWFKNPDYEQCLHLSISYRYPTLDQPLPHDHRDAAEWVKAFFGESSNLVWTEPPAFKEGRIRDVWHYHVFIDEHLQPIQPRGEVYSRELTEAGWQTYSDVTAEIAEEVRP